MYDLFPRTLFLIRAPSKGCHGLDCYRAIVVYWDYPCVSSLWLTRDPHQLKVSLKLSHFSHFFTILVAKLPKNLPAGEASPPSKKEIQ